MNALERTIALHFLRTGQFDLAETFLQVRYLNQGHIHIHDELLQESDATIPPEIRSQFVGLHEILKALRNHDITPALE